MFSGLNTEDMAFPKTWLVSVLDYQYWNNLTARVSLPYNFIVCFSNRAKNITCELLLCDSHGPRVNGTLPRKIVLEEHDEVEELEDVKVCWERTIFSSQPRSLHIAL